MSSTLAGRRDALRQAWKNRCLVSFRRRLERGSVSGYVVGMGPELFLVLVLGEDLRFNGFQAFRQRDVTVLKVPHPRAAFLTASLRLRGLRKPPTPRVSLASTGALLKSASRAFPLVTIHLEVVDRGACYIGQVRKLDGRRVALLEIDPGAQWHGQPTLYRLSDITRVDFGGGYEEALALVGGAKTRAPIRRSKPRSRA